MRKQSHAKLLLSIQAQEVLLRDIYERSSIEACGLLTGTIDAGGNWQVEAAHPLKNTHASPVYFEFAPEDLLAFELEHPGQVIGVYHSHPTGFPRASETDRKNMQRVNVEQAIPWVWLIISGPFRKADFPPPGSFASCSTIAYHHYERDGLQEIPVLLYEQTSDAKLDETR